MKRCMVPLITSADTLLKEMDDVSPKVPCYIDCPCPQCLISDCDNCTVGSMIMQGKN